MRSYTSRRFRDLYAELPENVRARAKQAFKLFQQDPNHPGLRFKKVEGHSGVYSARIGIGYRALGQLEGEDIVWFWIGPHGEYD